MSRALDVLGVGLVFSFVLCCVFSGLLQARAWSRHVRSGAPVSLRALLHPEQHFDAVGLRQILLARRLLGIGAVAYLSYGALMVATNLLR